MKIESLSVLLVTPRYATAEGYGGEVSVGLLARELSTRGTQVRVLAGTSDASGPALTVAPLTASNVAKAARGAEVVHAYNMESLGSILRGAHRANVPAVATANSYHALCLWADRVFPDGEACPGCGLSRLRRDFRTRNPLTIGRRVPVVVARGEVWRRTRTLARFERIVVLSQASRRMFSDSGVPASKIEVVPNFYDAALNPPKAPRGRDRSVLFMGTLKHPKGGSTLIDAMADLPGARLDVVGDGPERAAWTERARSKGVGDRVTFHGRVPYDRIGGFYAAAGVLAFPIWWEEPFGRVVLEAWAHGLPVVASNLGGPGEIIESGTSGLLVPRLDTVALAGALGSVLNDSALARRLAEAGRRRLEDFLPDKVLPRLLEVYRSCARKT